MLPVGPIAISEVGWFHVCLIQYRRMLWMRVCMSGSLSPPSAVSWIRTLYETLLLLPFQKKFVTIFFFYLTSSY